MFHNLENKYLWEGDEGGNPPAHKKYFWYL